VPHLRRCGLSRRDAEKRRRQGEHDDRWSSSNQPRAPPDPHARMLARPTRSRASSAPLAPPPQDARRPPPDTSPSVRTHAALTIDRSLGRRGRPGSAAGPARPRRALPAVASRSATTQARRHSSAPHPRGRSSGRGLSLLQYVVPVPSDPGQGKEQARDHHDGESASSSPLANRGQSCERNHHGDHDQKRDDAGGCHAMTVARVRCYSLEIHGSADERATIHPALAASNWTQGPRPTIDGEPSRRSRPTSDSASRAASVGSEEGNQWLPQIRSVDYGGSTTSRRRKLVNTRT
jgi:hypothetical protein